MSDGEEDTIVTDGVEDNEEAGSAEKDVDADGAQGDGEGAGTEHVEPPAASLDDSNPEPGDEEPQDEGDGAVDGSPPEEDAPENAPSAAEHEGGESELVENEGEVAPPETTTEESSEDPEAVKKDEKQDQVIDDPQKEKGNNNKDNKSEKPKKEGKKKMKKGVLVSYSPDCGFPEKRFVKELVLQLKENNMADDIWFDWDEKCINSPLWFAQRLDVAEKCKAAILILSPSYFKSPVSTYELRTLLERNKIKDKSVKLFVVVFAVSEIPRSLKGVRCVIDLTLKEYAKSSLMERAALAAGALTPDIEKYATTNAPYAPPSPAPNGYSSEFQNKPVTHWTVHDVQGWLLSLGIKEFYRQSFAENQIDGILLLSLGDTDLTVHLAIDSKIIQKKLEQVLAALRERERKLPDNWHLRCLAIKSKPESIYLIYDPADVRLAHNLKGDLSNKHFLVESHDSLGQSKEEFLKANCPKLAYCKYTLVILTESAASSPFIYNEVLFADWMGKIVIVAMFRNSWDKMRPALRAVLGDYPSIDFEANMYSDSMDVLEYQIRPVKKMAGVVLEQDYLNRLAESLKPFKQMIADKGETKVSKKADMANNVPLVYISYQWDAQSQAQQIAEILDSQGYPCWADISSTAMQQQQRAQSSSGAGVRGRSTPYDSHIVDNLQSQIQRTMKNCSVVVCCITQKYVISDNCQKDLALALSLNKPILPVLLRYIHWPPPEGPAPVRRLLSTLNYIDLSNDKLFKQNFHKVVESVKNHIRHHKLILKRKK